MAKQLNKSKQEVVLEFTADTKKAERELKSLQSSLERLASKNLNTTDLSVTKDLKEASNAALMLRNNLASATNVDTGKLDLSKFKKSMEQSNMSLQKYYDELIKLGPAGEQAFSSLASSISKADVKVKHVNKAIQEMKDTFSNTIRWQISSSVLHSLMGAVQSAYGYAQDLNESLNNIRIVTGYSTDQMSKFAEQANRAARALSTTTTEYTNASLIYYQQGLSDAEVQQRTDITIKMANVARQSSEVVSDQMTAIWNNFYDGSKSLEHYADVLTALGAKTASSTDEITGGLEKFAAVADTIGLSYEYAASALATITSNTRESEEVVGTALKTIFARIQGLNLGQTLDDGTTLNKYSKALDTVGISIFDQAGQLKEMDSILDELGSKWQSISKDEQVALAQTVAGVRQYTQLVALMDNWNNGDEDSFQVNLATANNATGALQEQSDIYAEGWESARDRVTAAAEAIYAKLINDDAFIGVLNVIEGILNGISSLIDGVGGLNGVLAIASTLMVKGFSKEISNNIRSTAETLSYFRDRKTTADKAKDTKREAIDVMIKNNKFMDNDSGRALASTYKGIGELQSFMLNNADRLTDEEKERLQWLMDQNEALAQQVRLQGQVSDKAEADALKQRIAVTSKYKDLESEAVTGYAQSMLEGGKAKSLASGLVGRLSSKNASKQNFQYALKDLDQIIGLQKVASESGAGFTDSVEDLNAMVKEAEKLRAKIEEISKRDVIKEEDEQALKQMAKDAEVLAGKTNAVVDKMKNDSGAMKKMAKGYDPTQQPSGNKKSNQPSWYKKAKKDLFELADSYEQAGQKAGEAAKGITAFEIANDSVLEIGEKMPGKVIDYADQFAAGAEAAVGYVSAVMSIKGAVDSLTNSDLTAWEKFISVAGSASTAITMIANSSRALTTVFANSTSMVGMFLAKLGAIAPQVALVAAVVGGLVVLFDWLIKTPEEKIADLKKEQDKLNAALAETNAELNEVKAAFDKYNTVKDTLDSCVVGTQAWNEALKNVNATVQELITQFPELLEGNWIQRDEKGNLTIDPEFFKQKQKTLETSSVYQQNGIIQNQVQTSNENINSIRRGITGGYLDLINDISNEELINLYNMDSSSRKDYFGKLILENSGNEELSAEQLNHIDTLENVFNEQRDEIEKLIQALDKHGYLIENSAAIIADNFLRLNEDAKYSQDVINNAGGIYQNVYDNTDLSGYTSEEEKQEALQNEFYLRMDDFNAKYLRNKNAYGNDYASSWAKFYSTGALDNFSFEDLEKLEKQKDLTEEQKAAIKEYKKVLGETKTADLEIGQTQGVQFDVNELNTLSSLYENAQKRLGDSGKDILQKIVFESGKSADELTKLLADVNWGDPAAVKKLNDEIEAQGLAVDTSSKEWQDYCAMMQESARAMEVVSVGIDSLRQKIAETNEIIEGIEVGSIISDEEYATLVATNPELEKFFGLAANGYKFLGTTDGRSLSSYLLGDSKQSLEDVQRDFKQLQQINDEISYMFDDNGNFKRKNGLVSNIDESLYKYLGYDRNTIIESVNFVNENKKAVDNGKEVKGYAEKLAEVEGFYSQLEAIQQQYQNGKFDDIQAEELWASSLVSGVTELSDAYLNGSIHAETFYKYVEHLANQDLSKISEIKSILAVDGDLTSEQSAYLDELEAQWDGLRKIADRSSQEYIQALDEIEDAMSALKIQGLLKESSQIEIDISANTDELERQLDAVSSKRREVVVEVVMDANRTVDTFEAQLNNFNAASKAIGENCIITRDNLELVAKAFPGALEEYQVLTDGTIQLNQQKLQSAMETAQAEADAARVAADAEIQGSIDALLAKKTANELTIQSLQNLLDANQESSGITQEMWGDTYQKIEEASDYSAFEQEDNSNDLLKELKKDSNTQVDLSEETAEKTAKASAEGFKEVARKAKDMVINVINMANKMGEAISNASFGLLKFNPTDASSVTNTYQADVGDISVGDVETNTEDDGEGYQLGQISADFQELISWMQTEHLSEKQVEYIEGVISNLQQENISIDEAIAELSALGIDVESLGKEFSNYVQNGGAGGQSKSAPATKIEETKKTDVVERYKEVNDVLDDCVELLNDVEKVSNRAYGKTHINGLKAQNHYLEEQIQLLQVKYKQAEQYLALDKQELQQAASKAGLSSFTFDKFGNISNYTSQMTEMYDQLHAAETYWNSIYTTKTQADQQKYMKEVIDPLKEKIEGLQDAIKQYDETRELMEDVQNEIDDAFYQWQDNNYEILHYTLEIEIALKDMELKRINYYLDKMSDNFYDMAEAAGYMFDQVPILLDKLEKYQDFYESIKQSFNDGQSSALDYVSGMASAYANGNVSQLDYVNGMKEAYEAIIETLGSLNELDKAMVHYYGDTLAAANEELTIHTDHMAHLTSVLVHYKDMVKLVNGEYDYDRIGTILEGQAESLKQEMNVLTSNYEMLLAEKDAIYASYMNATSEKEKEMYEQQLKDITETVDEAHEQMLAKTQEWAEAEKELLENTVAAAAKGLQDALTDNMGFDALMNSIDRLSTYQDVYLTKTNQIYETQKMMRTAQKAADATDNQASKIKLKNFMLETQSLQEKNALSQLELEIQQAKYDMLMAQIALEDAQNAKSTVRLQRDSEGNFGYVYTANMEDISQKEQELADAENNLYNISLEAANDYGQKRLELQQQLADELIELAERRNNGEFETDALYYAERDRLISEYMNLFIAYDDQYTLAVETNTAVQKDAWVNAYQDMMLSTDELTKSTDTMLGTCENAYKKWREAMEEDGGVISDVLHNFRVETEKITSATKEYGDLLENKIIPNLEKELGLVRDITGAYADQRDELNNMIDDYENTMDDIYDDVEEETYRDGDYPLEDMPKVDPNIKGNSNSNKKEEEEEEGNPVTGNFFRGPSKPSNVTSSNNASKQDNWLTPIVREEKVVTTTEYGPIVPVKKYDTGGYTGAWGSDGRLALLHQKELVLNADDTKNFLAATEILRGVSQFIDLQVTSNNFAARKLTSTTLTPSGGTLEQIVTIEANFPSVQDRNEIQEAFNNLINAASQYANRKI